MDEFLSGAGVVCLYIALAATPVFVSRRFIRIPDELFRKILHFVLLFAYIPFLYAFNTWWMPVLLAVIIAALAYPALVLVGRIPHFTEFVNERHSGEFKSSLLLAFGMLCVCIAVCWGWLGEKPLVLSCISWNSFLSIRVECGSRFSSMPLRAPSSSSLWETSLT